MLISIPYYLPVSHQSTYRAFRDNWIFSLAVFLPLSLSLTLSPSLSFSFLQCNLSTVTETYKYFLAYTEFYIGHISYSYNLEIKLLHLLTRWKSNYCTHIFLIHGGQFIIFSHHTHMYTYAKPTHAHISLLTPWFMEPVDPLQHCRTYKNLPKSFFWAQSIQFLVFPPISLILILLLSSEIR